MRGVWVIVVGNLISLVAALFMAASCVVRSKRLVFLCQFLECLILAAASIFFGSFAGTTTLLLSAARNLVIAREHYTRAVMRCFLFLTAAAGLLANSRGLVGLLPVIATLEYTVCCYYVTGVRATRCSIFVNLLLWIVYSFLILDFSTALSDLAVLAVDVAAILRLRRGERPAAEQTAASMSKI